MCIPRVRILTTRLTLTIARIVRGKRAAPLARAEVTSAQLAIRALSLPT